MVGMPDVRFAVLEQHQDRQQDGDGETLDGIAGQFAMEGNDRTHDQVEFPVLSLQPEVGGQGIEQLKTEEGGENRSLPDGNGGKDSSGKHGIYRCSSFDRWETLRNTAVARL